MDNNFAANLEVVMDFHRWTSKRLALAVDADASTIRRILEGNRGLSLGLALRICTALNVNIDDMCNKTIRVVPATLTVE